ncbi:MAG: DUF3592 domain-containing protein [Candidatus Omnitrophica bacterium]|nr:DUF3592 domain-containing protein [Candidatus Omnitrophota bacterium]
MPQQAVYIYIAFFAIIVLGVLSIINSSIRSGQFLKKLAAQRGWKYFKKDERDIGLKINNFVPNDYQVKGMPVDRYKSYRGLEHFVSHDGITIFTGWETHGSPKHRSSSKQLFCFFETGNAKEFFLKRCWIGGKAKYYSPYSPKRVQFRGWDKDDIDRLQTNPLFMPVKAVLDDPNHKTMAELYAKDNRVFIIYYPTVSGTVNEKLVNSLFSVASRIKYALEKNPYPADIPPFITAPKQKKQGLLGTILAFLIFCLLPMVLGGLGLLVGVIGTARGISSLYWPTTTGTVISSKVVRAAQDTSDTSYKPEVVFEYQIDSAMHTSNAIDVLDLYGATTLSSRSNAEYALKPYLVGKGVAVHYDPNRPERAILKAGVSGAVFLFLILGTIFVGVGVLVLWALTRKEGIRSSKNLVK